MILPKTIIALAAMDDANPQHLGHTAPMCLYVGVARPEFWSGARDLNPGPHGPEI